MKVKDLIEGIDVLRMIGSRDTHVSGIVFDSREVKSGFLFAAIDGTLSDGHSYIDGAIASGASAILCERLPEKPDSAVTWIQTSNSRSALALMASAWFGHPSREIKLVGVTGTNGKTTIATLLYKVHTGLGYKAGILTTIEIIVDGKVHPATHTTPDPMQINYWIREMVNAGCGYCFMEVSSHAASQHRVDGLDFDGGIFTNLTHDHLDYHKDFRDYLEAKRSFFKGLKPGAFALTNANDKNGSVILEGSKAGKFRYGLGILADFHGKIMEMHFDGMRMQLNDQEVWVRLTGKFNALNLLAIYGAAILLDHREEEVLTVLSNAGAAEGRFEVLKGKSGAVAVVDYAHTDDALKNVLETIHDINAAGLQVITVVGAGGDRDKTKRPKMGNVAAMLSDKVILTSDNPRSENPDVIISEMEAGIPPEKRNTLLKITDREEAIKTACLLGGENSVILVAGKGHEKYQVIQGVKTHFDDKEILTKYLR